MRRLTLPTDSAVRKDIPLRSGCYEYFPAALMRVAMISKIGNDKHNPGEPLHHARGKSMDHGDCIERHLSDIADYLAHRAVWTQEEQDAILTEAGYLCWRALALSQELHERFGAPLAPAARLPEDNRKAVERYPLSARISEHERQVHQPWCGLDTDHPGPCMMVPKDAAPAPSVALPDSLPPAETDRQSVHGAYARRISTRGTVQGGVDDPRHFERSDGPL